ncbi:MAG: aminopeptidase [Gammaproteobacteria bacterium]|nr:aminopeptidase [Gammaproteobacteria bacterium]
MIYKSRALLAIVLLAAGLTGCATLGYYGQSIGGQLEMLAKRRPIAELLDDPAASDELKTRLALILRLRAFASNELRLPDNASYRSYADLERPYAVWNVYAAPELSLTPKEWCFPVVGCVAYRGYFAKHAAEAFAADLRTQGYDVYVGGVAAYSTLGWFHDPMLNTLIHRPTADLAGLMFHELAHQQVYVRDDSAFNESFATAVEIEGARRWLAANGTPGQLDDYLAAKQSQTRFVALIMDYRARLTALYASEESDEHKRAAKAKLFTELRADHEKQRNRDGGGREYTRWFEQELNNARLVPVGVYRQYLAAFQALLAREGGDLAAFYRAVQQLADLPKAQRDARLSAPPPSDPNRQARSHRSAPG